MVQLDGSWRDGSQQAGGVRAGAVPAEGLQLCTRPAPALWHQDNRTPWPLLHQDGRTPWPPLQQGSWMAGPLLQRDRRAAGPPVQHRAGDRGQAGEILQHGPHTSVHCRVHRTGQVGWGVRRGRAAGMEMELYREASLVADPTLWN